MLAYSLCFVSRILYLVFCKVYKVKSTILIVKSTILIALIQ